MKSIRTFIVLATLLSGFSAKSQIVYSNNFATSLGTATASGGSSGNWLWNSTCAQVNTLGHSTGGVATFSGSSCQFGNGSNTVSGDLTTAPITIGASGAVLTFNYFLNTECQSAGFTCTYDVLTLQISSNGGTTWTNIMASNGTPPGLVHTSSWQPIIYSLNTYSNQTVLIRFNFNSIDGIGNAYDGAYVDDIIVTNNCFVSLTSLPGNSTVTPVICAGQSLTLTTNAVSNYSWSSGATTQSIVVSPTVNTQYGIVATSSANCTTSNTLNVIVNPALPTLTVVNTASLGSGSCPNSTVMLTASGSNTYTWVTTSVPVTNGVAFSPTTTAGYTVTGGNACGTSSAALSISIHPVPTVSAIVSQPTVCSGNPVTLTGLGSAISYTWNGSVANGSNIFPSATQNHTIVGSSALGCTASAIAPVTVVTTPIAPIVPSPPLICIGSSATLSSSGANVYNWTTPSGTLSGSQIVVSPLANAVYTLTKSNANCVNTQTLTLFVNLLPTVFAITSPTIICASTAATLNAGGALTYTWTGASGYTVSGSSPIVSPSVTTLYTVAASDGTCINTTTVLLTTKPNPTISVAASSTNICQGDVATITASGAVSYSWTAPAVVTNSNSASISESPLVPTLYQVIGSNSVNCTSSNQVVILVRSNPTLTILPSRSIVCAGGPANLTVTAVGGPCTYQWDSNAGAATSSMVTVNPLTSTSYSVVGLAANGCTASVNFPLTVFLPTFAVNSPTSSCLGGTVTLIASGATTYTWNGNQPFSQISVSPSSPTVYVVAATSTTVGAICVSTNTVVVNIYNNPTITAVATRTQVCRTETTSLVAGGGSTYTWSAASQTGSVAVVQLFNNSTFTVTGTDNNGCVNSTTVLVRTSTCFGLDELTLANRIDLKVYPNPNSGVFTISARETVSVVLENELGQFLGEYALNNFNNYQTSVKGLSQGIYFLTVIQNNERSSQKIVVSN
jgi:hypothetical protein